jgi:SlyX protein
MPGDQTHRFDSAEERFVSLETKVAYQEKLISELGEVLVEHSRTIDRLELRVLRLEQALRDNTGEPVGHDRPPHY